MINTLWPYVCGFLAFPSILGIYCLVASYCKLFTRVRELEQLREWDKKNYDSLYKRVIFEIPEIMRKNGWTI